MRRLCLTVSTALIIACGGGPPPAPKAPPAKVAALGGEPTPLDVPAAKVIGVLFSGDGLPDTDAMENALARRTLVAEVVGTTRSVEVGAQGVVCAIELTSPPGDVPDPNYQPGVEAQGLSLDEAKALQGFAQAAVVTCRAEDAPRAPLPVAEAVAEALAELLEGRIFDPQTGRYWPAAVWKQSREADNRFAIDRGVRVLRVKGADGDVWLGTRGMVAFGRADFELFPVPAAAADRIEKQMRVLADLVIEEPKGPGSKVSLGPVGGVLVPRDAYAATLPAGTAGVDVKTEGPAHARLVFADGDALQGDVEAQRQFFSRLSRR